MPLDLDQLGTIAWHAWTDAIDQDQEPFDMSYPPLWYAVVQAISDALIPPGYVVVPADQVLPTLRTAPSFTEEESDEPDDEPDEEGDDE